jgi:hypothetical protein
MTTRPLAFAVGSGRCGSTALSCVLRHHPDILSLSELFSSLEPHPFPEGPLTGEEFWRLLATPRPFTSAVMRDGFLPRLNQGPGSTEPSSAQLPSLPLIPPVAMSTLPHLTDTPGALFTELGRELPGWPRRPVAGHFRALFDFLGERFARHVVVERSGYSLRLVPRLRVLFPEAGFVHLHRDGPDTALSMSRHPVFRMIQFLMERAARNERGDADLSAEIEEMFREGAVNVHPALERPVPIGAFGRLWSDTIIEGLKYLGELPGSICMTMAFEGLLDAPDLELRRLAAHLGLEAPAEWLAAGRAELDSTRRGAAESLPAAELAELRESCAPGMAALGR